MATEMLDSLYTLIKNSTSQNTNPGSLETCACSDISATPYSTFHRCLKVKCPVSGAKMHIQYMNVARFYYVGSCTSRFKVLYYSSHTQLHIVAVQN